jgi:hypothetical protein
MALRSLPAALEWQPQTAEAADVDEVTLVADFELVDNGGRWWR